MLVDRDGQAPRLWTSGDSDGARQGTRVVVAPPPADGDKARRLSLETFPLEIFRLAESHMLPGVLRFLSSWYGRLWTSGDSDGARQGTRVVLPPPEDGSEARRPKP